MQALNLSRETKTRLVNFHGFCFTLSVFTTLIGFVFLCFGCDPRFTTVCIAFNPLAVKPSNYTTTVNSCEMCTRVVFGQCVESIFQDCYNSYVEFKSINSDATCHTKVYADIFNQTDALNGAMEKYQRNKIYFMNSSKGSPHYCRSPGGEANTWIIGFSFLLFSLAVYGTITSCLVFNRKNFLNVFRNRHGNIYPRLIFYKQFDTTPPTNNTNNVRRPRGATQYSLNFTVQTNTVTATSRTTRPQPQAVPKMTQAHVVIPSPDIIYASIVSAVKDDNTEDTGDSMV
jgi:hypothetical protein